MVVVVGLVSLTVPIEPFFSAAGTEGFTRPLFLVHYYQVDAISARFPTHTGDVAVVIRQLIERRFTVDPSFSGTWHWSSKEEATSGEPYTKFTIAKVTLVVLRRMRRKWNSNG